MTKGSERFKNVSKIGKEILLSKLSGKRIPVLVGFHVNTACNFRCKYCYVNLDGRLDQQLPDYSTEETLNLIDEMYDAGTRWLMILGGEPLLRKDIGEIIYHTKKKGMFCEIITNGSLIKQRIEDIKEADLLCLSLDGGEKANDAMRGKGAFKKIVEGIKIARENGIQVRSSAVISDHNMNAEAIKDLSKVAETYGTVFGFSIVNFNDYNRLKELDVSDEKMREFWRLVKEYKKKGKPIYNSYQTLDYMIKWPMPFQKIMKKKEELPKNTNFKFKPCFCGKRMAYIDCQGSLYPCIALGVTKGLNVKEVGFKKAWDALKDFNCGACGFTQYVEMNDALDLKLHSVMLGLKTFLTGK